ncbi:MAG: ABC transporter ATP-binding protein [Balneolaceae bacterium]
MNNTPIISINSLSKNFEVNSSIFIKSKMTVKAIDNLDLNINKGEILGLVGESGCGKSTLGQILLCLEKESSGTVNFHGKNILKLKAKEVRKLRSHMQMIFQDPFASLNPRNTVGTILSEPFRIHNKNLSKKEVDKLVCKLLEQVELSPDYYRRYPHEFSGGQRQRIGIARALALDPEFVVCDEAVSALDVSIQAQILNLLSELQTKHNLTYLFIAHDFNVVQYMSDRIAVMYLGRIVELVPIEKLDKNYMHPYTQGLIFSTPSLQPTNEQKFVIKGEAPSSVNPPSGCHFHPRCKYRMGICDKAVPPMVEVEKGHWIKCFIYK